MPDSPPQVVIANGLVRVRIHLPDPDRGFYRSTRFDWSGMVTDLEHRAHRYYGPWFNRRSHGVRDFEFDGDAIVAGPESAATGPAEEFWPPLGFDDAAPGGTFIKIGVGILQRSDAAAYSPFTTYRIVDPGVWTSQTGPDVVRFTQTVEDSESGWGYSYEKTMRLAANAPALEVEHSLRNMGHHPIVAAQYSHNFLTLDGESVGPDLVVTVPFAIDTTDPPDPGLARIDGRRIMFTKRLTGRERVSFPFAGFGDAPDDYDIRVHHRVTGTGVRVTADRPVVQLMLWSIRSVLSVEPFVDVSTEPGAVTSWRYTYTYS